MLFINADYGYASISTIATINETQWADFIVDAIDELVSSKVSYDRPMPKRRIEDHIKALELDHKQANLVDFIVEELGTLITNVTDGFGGYTELSVVKRYNGYQITALTDHRIAEWYRGRGKAEPEENAIEYNTPEFTKALRESTFGGAYTAVKPPKQINHSTSSSPSITEYLSGMVAFVDGHNMSQASVRRCDVRGATVSDSLYEVSGEGAVVFGNWVGTGELWCPLEPGDIIEITLDKESMRPTLRIV